MLSKETPLCPKKKKHSIVSSEYAWSLPQVQHVTYTHTHTQTHTHTHTHTHTSTCILPKEPLLAEYRCVCVCVCVCVSEWVSEWVRVCVCVCVTCVTCGRIHSYSMDRMGFFCFDLCHIQRALYLSNEPYSISKEPCTLSKTSPAFCQKSPVLYQKRALHFAKRALHAMGRSLYCVSLGGPISIECRPLLTECNPLLTIGLCWLDYVVLFACNSQLLLRFTRALYIGLFLLRAL